MTMIRELKQKGAELKQRIEKFGAPLGNKNAAGPHDGSGRNTSLMKNVREVSLGKDRWNIVLNGWNQGRIFRKGRSWRWVSSSGGDGKATSKSYALNRLLAANKT